MEQTDNNKSQHYRNELIYKSGVPSRGGYDYGDAFAWRKNRTYKIFTIFSAFIIGLPLCILFTSNDNSGIFYKFSFNSNLLFYWIIVIVLILFIRHKMMVKIINEASEEELKEQIVKKQKTKASFGSKKGLFKIIIFLLVFAILSSILLR